MRKEAYQGKFMPFNKEHLNQDDSSEALKFRLTARHLFLIYKHSYLTKEAVIEQLQKILKNKIKEYIVSQENSHENTFIFYVYLKLSYKINILNPNRLNLKDSLGNIIKGQYKAVKNIEKTKNFLKEFNNYITSPFDSDIFYSNLCEIAEESGLNVAMDYFSKQKPEWVSIRYKNIRSNLQSYLSNTLAKKNLKFLSR